MTYTSAQLRLENVVAMLGGAGFQVDRFRPVERTLLDTFDGRLHSAGVRLELRKSAERELILSGGGPATARTSVDRVPSVAADLPAGPLRTRLAPLLGIRALLPIVTIAAHQAAAMRRNGSDKVVVGILLEDRPELVPPTTLSLPWTAEVRPYEGYPRAARQAEELLRSLGMTRCEGDVLDVAAEEAGIDLRGFVDSPTVPLDRSEPAAPAFRRVLANLAETVERNWGGTVEDVDPEFLHDLRVAVRRTRSVLSQGKAVLPADGRDHFRAEFRWLGATTSPARDLDVIEWPDYIAPLGQESSGALVPVVDHIRNRQAAEHDALAAQLRSARYHGLMSGWGAWLGTPGDTEAMPKLSMRPLGDVVATRLSRAQDQVLARGDRPGNGRRGASRASQGRQEGPVPPRMLRRCLSGRTSQGLRPTAEGAAGEPRRAPGHRGPRCPTAGHVQGGGELAGGHARDVSGHGTAPGALRAATPRGPQRVRRPVRQLRERHKRSVRCSMRRAGRERPPVKVLATYSIKGGVGKTTCAVNLAYEAARTANRVLIWDLDPQGAATFFFRISPRVKGGTRRLVGAKGELVEHVRASDLPGVHVVPADFSLRHLDLYLDDAKRPTERLASLLAGVDGRYDLALLDCPPSISLASESVFGAAHALLVPVIPTTLSSRTLHQLSAFLDEQQSSPTLLPYFSMVDGRKRLHRDLMGAMRAEWPGLLDTAIPNASAVERMGPARAPVGVYAPSSPAAKAFRSLWVDITARLWA